jgi:hypothetical protein
MNWQRIAEAKNELEANMIKAYLKNAQIESVISPDASALTGVFGTQAFTPWSIYVGKEVEKEALELVNEFLGQSIN